MWPVGVENEVKATHKRLLFFWLNHKMTNGTGFSKRILRIISLTQCLKITKKSITLQHCDGSELQFQLSYNFRSILARKLKKKWFVYFLYFFTIISSNASKTSHFCAYTFVLISVRWKRLQRIRFIRFQLWSEERTKE